MSGLGTAIWAAFSAALAGLMARRGLRKGSLEWSGALAAVAVGTLHLTFGLQYGLTLIFFYLSSSKLTKLGSRRKQQLEAEHKEGGRRNATQVLSNSLAACLLAAAAYATARPGVPAAVSVLLSGAFLGHYACCCGDTWASEVGILSRQAPRLITTGAAVPPGTNGGVSPLGLACSVAAGAATGLVFGATAALACAWGQPLQGGGLCIGGAGGSGMAGAGWPAQLLAFSSPAGLLPLVAAGAACGLFGSLLDSLLGATVQFSGLELATSKVVQTAGPGVKHISGIALLTNDGVNAVSALASAALGAFLLMKVSAL